MTEYTDLQIDGTPMRPVFNEVARRRRLDPVELRSIEPSVRDQVGLTRAAEVVGVRLSPAASLALLDARSAGVEVEPVVWSQEVEGADVMVTIEEIGPAKAPPKLTKALRDHLAKLGGRRSDRRPL